MKQEHKITRNDLEDQDEKGFRKKLTYNSISMHNCFVFLPVVKKEKEKGIMLPRCVPTDK